MQIKNVKKKVLNCKKLKERKRGEKLKLKKYFSSIFMAYSRANERGGKGITKIQDFSWRVKYLI